MLTCHLKIFPVVDTEKVVFVPTKMFLFIGCAEIVAAVPAIFTFAFVPVYAVAKPVTLPFVVS